MIRSNPDLLLLEAAEGAEKINLSGGNKGKGEILRYLR
jgi:hypothetical protein